MAKPKTQHLPRPAVASAVAPQPSAVSADKPGTAAQAKPTLAASPQDQTGGCLLRLTWMMLGNLGLLISLTYIEANRESMYSAADVVFWAVAAALVGVRYVDIAHFHGRTASGKPATMADWRRYALLLPGVCLVLWLIAHAMSMWL